jgi:Protein of unknown function (DUF3297)
LGTKGNPSLSRFATPSDSTIHERRYDAGSFFLSTQRFAHNAMTDATEKPALPDRLSADPKSKFHHADVFQHDVGIRLNDVERNDVEEYCVSEGWVKVPVGNSRDRKGNPLTIKLKGRVEAYYR